MLTLTHTPQVWSSFRSSHCSLLDRLLKKEGGKKNIFITSSYYVSLTKATEIFVSHRSKPVLHTPSCQGEWEGELKKKSVEGFVCLSVSAPVLHDTDFNGTTLQAAAGERPV